MPYAGPARLALCIAVFGAAGLGALPGTAPAAHAQAPQVRTQAPGYYRLMVGKFEITALSDGTVKLPVDQLLTHTTPAQVDRMLALDHLSPPVETSVNGFLVNTGRQLVLIDTGAAGLFGPTLGRLVANLQAAGYRPEQVDEILITHMHADHVGGLATPDGKAVFPNAIVRASQQDADYWLSEKNLQAAKPDEQGAFRNAMASLKPYVDSGRFKPFSGATDLLPGLRAVPAPGHTPGHTIYLAESEGQRIAFWGDLLHVAAVQFAQPQVTIAFDSDARQAEPSRLKNFADAARQGYLVAFAHVSFPGIGHLRAQGRGYVWQPVNYSATP
ncbi:MAG: MBL fold metallo-hydrolase [Burkholderiales bacterium]|nr:MBL fold metallo-hydrolase [Burkholderiales bacterium]MDE2276883.1 MBL fold metallo-hydrolase [Burkholderiales bacterium]